MAAFFLAAGLLTAPPASADPTTIYVRATSCSNSGSGSAGNPFCTIQHALDVVEPGQTVALYGSDPFYESPTLTRSGTEDSPITITTVGGSDRPAYLSGYGSTGPVFTISGAHDIIVRDIEFSAGSVSAAEAIVLDNASRISLDQLLLRPRPGHTGLRITNSSVITLSRSNISTAAGSDAIHATLGAELTLARNTFSYGVLVEQFDNVAISGNRFYGLCAPALAVTGPSNTVSIQNNAFVRRQLSTCPVVYFVEVDAATTPTTTLDYNNITTATNAYLWAGTSYDAPTDLHAATGQAAHDLVVPSSSLPSLHDNANADAPGTLIETAADNPNIPNTGTGTVTYLDRGPYEYYDYFTNDELELSASTVAPGEPMQVISNLKSYWQVPFTCTIDYGDGTIETASPCAGSHVYTNTGTYQLTVTATNASGLTKTLAVEITV